MLLVDDDDGDDEEADQIEAVQHEQEPLADDPPGDQLLKGQGRADGEVAIWSQMVTNWHNWSQKCTQWISELADEEVGGGELSGAVDDVEEERPDPEHGVDSPSVPWKGNFCT